MESVGTVTFLFTDIEGSTRLVRELRDTYGEVLEAHRGLLRDAVAGNDGEEVDTQGDAFFFTFRRARDGVLAAAQAQRTLAVHAWPGGAVVKVRMGLHTGEPGRSVTGYHGIGVVRAARISAAGHGGQVLVSQATRALVEDEELPGISFRDLGEHRLKDIDRPERLSQLVMDGLPSDFPPLRGSEQQTVKEEFVAPRRSRRVLVLAAVPVALAVVAGIVYFATRGKGGEPVAVVPNSVAAIDPDTNSVVRDTAVGDQPTRIVAAGDSVWVLNEVSRTVSRLDTNRDGGQQTFAIGRVPDDIAVGADALWEGDSLTHTVERIDPTTGVTTQTLTPRISRYVPSIHDAGNVAFGSGDVWFASGNSTLARIDPAPPHVKTVIRGVLTDYDGQIVARSDAVWVADCCHFITHVDPQTNEVLGRAEVGWDEIGAIALDSAGSVWATNKRQASVWQIDPARHAPVRSFDVGAFPTGVAVGADSVWTANSVDGTVSRLDPATGRTTTIRVGGSPNRIVFAGGLIWVTVD